PSSSISRSVTPATRCFVITAGRPMPGEPILQPIVTDPGDRDVVAPRLRRAQRGHHSAGGSMATLIPHALAWWKRALPERVALDVGGEELTYRELGDWSRRVAAGLVDEHGVGPGDVVALAGHNSLEWCVAAIAVLGTGAVLTPVNFRWTVSELEHLV